MALLLCDKMAKSVLKYPNGRLAQKRKEASYLRWCLHVDQRTLNSVRGIVVTWTCPSIPILEQPDSADKFPLASLNRLRMQRFVLVEHQYLHNNNLM